MTALLFVFSFAYALDDIGSIKSVKGSVKILRGDKSLDLTPGMKIFVGDIIKSASDGSAGLIFTDGTVFSVGSSTEIILNKYMFQPKDNKYSMRMNMKRGTAVYESGRMAKLAPEAIEIQTPKATIGVRGTKFLVKVD
jgi:hypothetical protein